MRRLAGADALFLYTEDRLHLQHTLKIAVVDPAGATVPVTYAALREQVREAVPLVEPFRWRLAPVPLHLGHPYWVEDPRLDLDYHVRRAAAPAPGGARELAEVVSTIASTALERDRPLWQVWFVDALEHGHVAYVAKVHHALADGLSSERLLTEVFGDRPGETTMPVSEARVGERVPSRPELARRGAADTARLLAGLPALVARTARSARRSRARSRAGREGFAAPFSGPATRFARPLTPQRWFAYATLPLDDVRRVAHATGSSVNDVFLALVSGATREYLARHRELPAEPLTASVPVSTRRPGEERLWGNRLATWYVSLATDVADPVDRLRAIGRHTRAAREAFDAIDPDLQHDWAEYWPLFRLGVFGLPKLARPFVRGRPSYDLVASSVRGPSRPLYRHGARLVRLVSMGPLVEGIGLNFTAWSYCDELDVGVMACREHVPDVWDLADGLHDALGDLVAAVPDAAGPAARA